MMRLTLFLLLCSAVALAQTEEPYQPGPDSNRQPGVPKGTVTSYRWDNSKVYPGTKRAYHVYVPAQYDASKPAALMVFQDGFTYMKEDGEFRVTVVYDNLIHRKELPVTIVLFVNPGYWNNEPENLFRSEGRSYEYDDVTDQYATFLINEIIPEVKKKYNISDDPKMHGIAGISSGGICAFTAAWFRPDYFHKVLSHVGSFTNIRGGDAYPSMIRKSAKRDMRVLLQGGEKDLNNNYGNWWLANLQMKSSLEFRGYDFRFEGGVGGHNGKHGGAILPESLKWLWSGVTN